MTVSAVVATTPRLTVRTLTLADAPFIVELLNDPAFLEFIGDKNVRTVDDARHYIASVPLASYARHGFGHYLVELGDTREPIGICSLVKREWLADVDLGFAYLPRYRGQGYAFEAASALMAYARDMFGLGRLVAITSRHNAASVALLERLGFAFERLVAPPGSTEQLNLFALALNPALG